MENIQTPANVEHSKSTDGTDCYTVKFSGTVTQVDHVRPNDELLHLFKKGILAERERIWDEGEEIEEKILRRLLRQDG
ncbi:hypothetical protein ABER99_21430 [Paenibacillus glucanolyticus]|jgi:hypothetical protein|uniref:Uncharacterized protein n=1 Tax=Paenibacillus glucanolyticus TaxID=59843 RepID=A0A163G5J8_9BACL|nr:hypothetical protein [Paenibacillus glucanolyticus]KZS44743.1 hypothetical protein AWU65_01770 [Paenibacillus glucanolyticus]OMF64410.1 hypothetical protein BK142_32005 [Paenibacillus glucanolyticus]